MIVMTPGIANTQRGWISTDFPMISFQSEKQAREFAEIANRSVAAALDWLKGGGFFGDLRDR